MAQKTEKEDAEIKSVPETLTPCIINSNNNISITGIASTNHSNCFTYSPPSSSLSEPCSFGTEARTGKEMKKQVPVAETHQPVRNRCSGCRRKVGLTGFRCRCGDLFCSEHRYSDRHVCSYDYKSAGKAAIARENPVVKASKINRI